MLAIVSISMPSLPARQTLAHSRTLDGRCMGGFAVPNEIHAGILHKLHICYSASSRYCDGPERAGTSLLIALSVSQCQAHQRSS